MRLISFCYCLRANLRNGLLCNMVDSPEHQPSFDISVAKTVNMKFGSGDDTVYFPLKVMVIKY